MRIIKISYINSLRFDQFGYYVVQIICEMLLYKRLHGIVSTGILVPTRLAHINKLNKSSIFATRLGLSDKT